MTWKAVWDGVCSERDQTPTFTLSRMVADRSKGKADPESGDALLAIGAAKRSRYDGRVSKQKLPKRYPKITGRLVRARERSSVSNTCRNLSASMIATESWGWFDEVHDRCQTLVLWKKEMCR